MNTSHLSNIYNFDLKNFIDDSYNNTNTTLQHMAWYYERFTGIHKAFQKIINNGYNSRDWFSAFFLYGAHSCILSAIQLSTSGQLSESYMVQRGCIENSLYGLFIHKNLSLRETWLRRHDDQKMKEKVKSTFKISELFKLLASIDSNLNTIIHDHYEQTIDYGAHPNEKSLTTVLQQKSEKETITFSYNYFNNSQLPFKLCLKTNARVGVGSLLIFQIIFKGRFDILGISEDLKSLCDGL